MLCFALSDLSVRLQRHRNLALALLQFAHRRNAQDSASSPMLGLPAVGIVFSPPSSSLSSLSLLQYIHPGFLRQPREERRKFNWKILGMIKVF